MSNQLAIIYLLSKINIDPVTGCWLWVGAICSNGYGMAYVEKKNVKAHRATYKYFVGNIPAGAVICHRCDVPSCVNPDHLFVGSHADNMADMVAKGRAAKGMRNGFNAHPEKKLFGDKNPARIYIERMPRGEQHKNAKLESFDVWALRMLAKHGFPRKELAKLFNIGKTTANKIINRQTWKHI